MDVETVRLWFQPLRRRVADRIGLPPASATYEGKLVRLCRQHFCDLCVMPEREKLRGFRGGNLEVRLTLHRTPSLWEERRFYLGHLASVLQEPTRAALDEGLEIDDSRRLNAVLYDFGAGMILVDPGFMGANGAERVRYLIEGQRVVATLVSHGHYDHWDALGESKGLVYMTELAFRLASRHASLEGNDLMVEAVGRARKVVPGDPILTNNLPVKIETFVLPHSIPETMGFVIKGQRGRAVHLGDFRFNGMTSGPKFATINRLEQIAREEVDVLALTIFNAHVDGFAPIEDLAVGSVADIIRMSRRTIITCFSTNLRRIERLADRAKLLGRQVQFFGSGMENARNLIEFENAAGDSERAVIFVTGCQAEEGSVLWRIANNQNPPFELRQDDTLIFSSRFIPGNEEDKLRQLYAQLRPQVGRLFVQRNEIASLGLMNLGLEDALTHVSGHENREGLRLALEILRPKKVLAWPQVSPQIDSFREICEEFGVELLDESERVIEI